MKRIDCLRAIYDELSECAVITIMGAVAVELYSLGHRPNFFYLEHAMGLASSMGLGLALSQTDRKVVIVDGDGSVLMNLGGLTTLARYAPRNITHIIFDNQSLLSVGGFPTATAACTDLAACARAAGIRNVTCANDVDAFVTATRVALASGELSSVVASVDAIGPTSFHMDLHMLENRFEFARAMRS